MTFLKWLFHKHEYNMCIFRSPTREAVNLSCVHCSKQLVYFLSKNWDV